MQPSRGMNEERGVRRGPQSFILYRPQNAQERSGESCGHTLMWPDLNPLHFTGQGARKGVEWGGEHG